MKVARLSSWALLLFIFAYASLYLVQVQRLLPADGLAAGSDPYELRAPPRGALEVFSSATSSHVQTGRVRQQATLTLSAGEALPASEPLQLRGSAISIATWLKPKRRHAATQCIASLGQTWVLALRSNGCLTFAARDSSGAAVEHTSVVAAPTLAWTHVAAAYDERQGELVLYINGTSSAFSVRKEGQEWAAIERSDDMRLQLASCSAFNGSSGGVHGQWIGWLAGTTVVDHVMSPDEVASGLQGSNLAGTMFSLAAAVGVGASSNQTAIPARPKQNAITDQFLKTSTCSIPSPNAAVYRGVPKAPSITAMAWIQLADTPRHKEACIMSHGSWEKGWKLSLTPHLNLQFTVRTSTGEVRDYFSKRIDSHGDWQQVAVAYNGNDGIVQFYTNGFPVDTETAPQGLADKDSSMSTDDAPFTIGRCQANFDADEKLKGKIADIVLWNQPLDFMALRMALHRGVPAALTILQRSNKKLAIIFAMPSAGCDFNVVGPPKFPAGWKPNLQPSSKNLLQLGERLLQQTAIVIAPTADIPAALHTLNFIDAEMSLISINSVRLKAVVLVANMTSDFAPEPVHFKHLHVVYRAAHIFPAGGHLPQIASSLAEDDVQWVLMVTDSLKPMEYWLWNLMSPLLAAAPEAQLRASKSLTLSNAGSIKSAGLQHQSTALGDGKMLALPFMLYRGYPVNYLSNVLGHVPNLLEATTCESLLIDRDTLVAGASRVPKDMAFLYQCAALTAPLVRARQLHMALDSWVLDQVPAGQFWNPNSDSMLRFHESHHRSAELYSQAVGPLVEQVMAADLQTNLTVKWMFACGGSWAWEAANLVEHLNRKVQLRVQIQKPFQYCDGHNVLGAAAASFTEQIERMMHLPSLRSPLPAADQPQGLEQDDVVILHRDYFRVTNWINPVVKRPKYLVGRYMNEVSSLHARLVEQCNSLDEVWVPSQHHVEVFSKAGVQRSKLVVIPESIDTNYFDPDTVQPLALPRRRKFVFLSNFKFEERKNWKALVWAYCNAFTSQDDVSLYIHTNLQGKFDKMGTILQIMTAFIDKEIIGATMHKDNTTIPHIALTGRPLSTRDMMSLYKASNAFVLPTHGEGWGLPLHEAMAMGLPTISTAWGGNTQFMLPRNSYLIQVKEFEETDPYDDWLRNMKWAKPDETHLSNLLREVYDYPEKAKAKGQLARQDILASYSNQAVATLILDRLGQIQHLLSAGSVPPATPVGLQFQWTAAPDVKVCSSMKSLKRDKLAALGGAGAAGATAVSRRQRRRLQGADVDPEAIEALCSAGSKRKVAFVTPYPPRRDGLGQYASNLRTAILAECAGLQVDVFAVVLDFWNAENEIYDSDIVRFKIARESYSDYEAAAEVINREYDAAVLNFKLGAIGGTQCAFATCFAKLLAKPLVTIVHSLSHNIDDPLQATLLYTLAESDAAVVFSGRARLELDTAAGFIPGEASMLQAARIWKIPHGADVPAEFPNKEEKKTLLGLRGKTVLLTFGFQGPDKGADHTIRALGQLPSATRESLIYVIAGRPGDCGQPCLDYHAELDVLINKLGLAKQVLIINEFLSEDAVQTILTAADIFMAVYPEDLFPHPATFYRAMAHGCAVLATPFTAALAHMPSTAGRLLWDRSPDIMARQLLGLVNGSRSLADMQQTAWRASHNMSWQHSGRALSAILAGLL